MPIEIGPFVLRYLSTNEKGSTILNAE